MVGSIFFSGKEVVRIFSFSVGMEVIWTILLVFIIVLVVSLIIDVAISLKEIVSRSDSSSIFVDSFILIVGKTFSLVETDCIELPEVTLEFSLIEEVVSIIGSVNGILIIVVSTLEVLNSDSKACVVSLKELVVNWDFSSKKVLSNCLVSFIMKVVGSLNIALLKSVKPSVSSRI